MCVCEGESLCSMIQVQLVHIQIVLYQFWGKAVFLVFYFQMFQIFILFLLAITQISDAFLACTSRRYFSKNVNYFETNVMMMLDETGGRLLTLSDSVKSDYVRKISISLGSALLSAITSLPKIANSACNNILFPLCIETILNSCSCIFKRAYL